MAPDVNILVAAFRPGHVHHTIAREWLAATIQACSEGATIEILPMVAAGFLRLVTNPKVFADPDPLASAMEFIDALLAVPGITMPTLSGEWPVMRRMCQSGKLRGNDIPDAWLAAAVRTSGGHLVTLDRGFARLLDRHELTVLATAR